MEAITKSISLDVRKNEPSFFKVLIKNIYEYKEIFSLKVNDDVPAKYSDEVKLLKKVNELEIWTNQGVYEQNDFNSYKE